LVIVDEAGGEEAEGIGVGDEGADDGEVRGGGERGEGVGVAFCERDGERLEALGAGCFVDGLELLVVEAAGEYAGERGVG
jgi:hypothetical protein